MQGDTSTGMLTCRQTYVIKHPSLSLECQLHESLNRDDDPLVTHPLSHLLYQETFDSFPANRLPHTHTHTHIHKCTNMHRYFKERETKPSPQARASGGRQRRWRGRKKRCRRDSTSKTLQQLLKEARWMKTILYIDGWMRTILYIDLWTWQCC